MKTLPAITIALALAACTPAAPAPEAAAPPATAPAGAQEIRNTSSTDANGVRTIQLSALIPASQQDVWTAIATVDGWKTWAAPSASGSVGPGQRLETSYDPAARPGDPGNIVQEFTQVQAPGLIAFRTIKAPEGFPHSELYYQTSTTIELASEGETQTRLTLTHAGFGPGEGFDQLHSFFEAGDAATLEQLRKRFETGPVDWTKQQ